MVVKTVKGKQVHLKAELYTRSLAEALAKVEAAKPGESYELLDDEAAAIEAVQCDPLTMKYEPVPCCSA